jgi:hypothetical protein
VAAGLANLFHAFGGRFDNRDWPQIDTWADRVAETLRTSTD